MLGFGFENPRWCEPLLRYGAHDVVEILIRKAYELASLGISDRAGLRIHGASGLRVDEVAVFVGDQTGHGVGLWRRWGLLGAGGWVGGLSGGVLRVGDVRDDTGSLFLSVGSLPFEESDSTVPESEESPVVSLAVESG